MPRGDETLRRRPSWRARLVTSAALGVLVTACAATSADHLSVVPAQQPQSSGDVVATIPGTITPEQLTIPAINVSTALVALGLNADDTVEVPARPQRAGWFELGTVPGDPGSSVILGHVDSREGPAVFHQLNRLQRGDLIDVTLSNASVNRFRVVRVATYANADFPARRVYAGSRRRRALNLVTCGGRYDAARGGYQSNVVVYAELTTRGWLPATDRPGRERR